MSISTFKATKSLLAAKLDVSTPLASFDSILVHDRSNTTYTIRSNDFNFNITIWFWKITYS